MLASNSFRIQFLIWSSAPATGGTVVLIMIKSFNSKFRIIINDYNLRGNFSFWNQKVLEALRNMPLTDYEILEIFSIVFLLLLLFFLLVKWIHQDLSPAICSRLQNAPSKYIYILEIIWNQTKNCWPMKSLLIWDWKKIIFFSLRTFYKKKWNNNF